MAVGAGPLACRTGLTSVDANLPRIAVVVPCYNESARLAPEAWLEFLDSPEGAKAHFYFANDGSTDATPTVLARLGERSERVHVLDFGARRGKAETVRRAMLEALGEGFDYVGFWDADLATPLAEVPRLAALAVEHRLDGAFCSRVKRMGSTIQRSPLRHGLGRVFATATSVLFRLPAYDTQCGAKLFRAEAVREALREPFISPWIFDVEVILRMRGQGFERLLEMPVAAWVDVGGSTMRLRDFVRVPVELAKMARRYR